MRAPRPWAGSTPVPTSSTSWPWRATTGAPPRPGPAGSSRGTCSPPVRPRCAASPPGKDIIIAETASAEAGGSKTEWNTHLVHYLVQQPHVTGPVWFHCHNEADRRINSTGSSATALAAERPCP